MVTLWGYLGAILSLSARHGVLRALRTSIFVLSKKNTAPSLTLDVVAEMGWTVGVRSLHGQVFFDVFAVHLGLVALGDDFASG